jgi:hypothetical protein
MRARERGLEGVAVADTAPRVDRRTTAVMLARRGVVSAFFDHVLIPVANLPSGRNLEKKVQF